MELSITQPTTTQLSIKENKEVSDGIDKSSLENFPKEIHCLLNDNLSVYDCGRLSMTNQYMRAMFFSVALIPGYKITLNIILNAVEREREETKLEDLPLFTSKLASNVQNLLANPDMADKEIFDEFELCRKPKYLRCDNNGLSIMGLDMNSPLIKLTITNKKKTVEQILAKKEEVIKRINKELDKNLLAYQRNFLESNEIRECLFIDFINFDDVTKNWYRSDVIRILKIKCFQEAIGNNQITKKDFFSLKHCVASALENSSVLYVKEKGLITLFDILKYPKQILFLCTTSWILIPPSPYCQNYSIKEEFSDRYFLDNVAFKLTPIQMKAFRISIVQRLIDSNNLQIEELLKWEEKGVNALSLFWINDFMRNEDLTTSLSLIWLVFEKADLLLEIDEKYKNYSGLWPKVTSYLRDIWSNKLTAKHCITEDPDVIRMLLLSDIDQQLAFAVRENIVTVETLFKLKPEKIKIIANESVQIALEVGILTVNTISEKSWEEIIELISGNVFTPKDNCVIQ